MAGLSLSLALSNFKFILIFVLPFQGLIFVVDSNDRERIEEAKDELSKMVRPAIMLSFKLST